MGGADDRHDYEAEIEGSRNQREHDRSASDFPASCSFIRLIQVRQAVQWKAPLAITASEGGVCHE
jgi:hypothetical protein